MYTQQQIETLAKNFEGTKWTKLRLEKGQLVVDFNGEMIWPIGGGKYQSYNGVTPCRIFDVSKDVLEKEYRYGDDQNGFMSQKFDYEPLHVSTATTLRK